MNFTVSSNHVMNLVKDRSISGMYRKWVFQKQAYKLAEQDFSDFNRFNFPHQIAQIYTEVSNAFQNRDLVVFRRCLDNKLYDRLLSIHYGEESAFVEGHGQVKYGDMGFSELKQKNPFLQLTHPP